MQYFSTKDNDSLSERRREAILKIIRTIQDSRYTCEHTVQLGYMFQVIWFCFRGV